MCDVPLWQSTFFECVKQRNDVETDRFAEIYAAYTAYANQLRSATVSQAQWTPISTAADRFASDETAIGGPHEKDVDRESFEFRRRLEHARKDKADLEECNLLLRDQIRSYEANLRAMDVEVKAAHLCLRDLESELRERETRLKDLEATMLTLLEENRGLQKTRLRLESHLLAHTVERQKIEDELSHDAEVFVDVTDLDKESAALLDESSPVAKRKGNVDSCSGVACSVAATLPHCSLSLSAKSSERILSAQSPKRAATPLQPRVKVVARPHNGAITSLDMLPRSGTKPSMLISGGYDGYLAVLDPATLRVTYSFKVAANDSAIVCVRLSSDHRRAIVACLDACLYIALLERQKTTTVLTGHAHHTRITGCGFLQPAHWTHCHSDNTISPRTEETLLAKLTTSSYCFSVGTDKTVRVWDTERGICLSTTKAANPVTAASMVLDGRLILGHQNGCITVWSLAVFPRQELGFQCLSTIRPLAPLATAPNTSAVHEDASAGVSCSCVGTTGYSLGRDGRLVAFSVQRSSVRKSFFIPSDFKPPNASATPVASPCGHYVIAPSQAGIYCWESASGKCTGVWSTPAATTCLLWDSEVLISAHADGSLLLWCV